MVNWLRRALGLFGLKGTQKDPPGHGDDEDNNGCRREMKRLARLVRRRQPTTAFDWLSYANRSQGLRLLHRNQIHVDTTIVTSDCFSSRVHWQVMMALCPKLIEVSELIECKQTPNQAALSPMGGGRHQYILQLPCHITGPVAFLLIECAYGEPKLPLETTNVEQLYDIALEYDIDYVLRICLDFARTILNINNCIYLHLLSLRHSHQKLRRASYSMIRSNFKLILHVNKDFHLLGANQLKQLLLDNLLKLNDDEEIAWMAIVRWQRRQLLTQSEMANLYNKMVSGHRDMQLIHWSVPMNQLQLIPTAAGGSEEDRRSVPTSRTLSNNGTTPRAHLRLALDFYSPANPIETSLSPPQMSFNRKNRQKGSVRSPLRRAAEKQIGRRLPNEHLEQIDEAQLYSLVKCLRFMRFKSLAAFDTIQACAFIRASERLTQLVNHMRIAYKLHHGLALNEKDRQAISSKQLQRLKTIERSKTECLVETFVKLMRFQPTFGGGQRGLEDGLQEPQRHARSSSPPPPPEALVSRQSQIEETTTNDNNEQSKISNRNEDTVDKHRPNLSNDLEMLGQRTLQCAAKPRVPISVGLLIGGWQDGRVSKSIWAYDFVSDKWFKLNIKLPEARAFHVSCSSPTKGHIYIFGGTNGEAILDSVLKLNLASDVYIGTKSATKRGGKGLAQVTATRLEYRFKQLRPMNERRCHLSGVFHSDGRLYALGGHNGTQRLRSGEWYDSNSNQWHQIAEMTIARADAAACSHENKIFIAGGQISDQFIQSSVEFYKSSDNTWTFAAPMIIPRMSFCMVSYKGQVLAIGGTNGLFGGEEMASVTRTVERYNHSAGSWSFCAPMISKRCSFGVMQIGNKLMVMGGHGGRRRLKSCESLRIGHFNAQSINSLIALSRSVQNRLHRMPTQNDSGRVDGGGGPPPHETPATVGITLKDIDGRLEMGGVSQGARQQPDELPNRMPTIAAANSGNNNNPSQLSTSPTTNELLTSVAQELSSQTLPRSAMKWIPRSKLPERRSGFSVVAIHKLKNAKDFTYYGSLRPTKTRPGRMGPTTTTMPSFVRQPGRWHRFKIIKRRKLVKHLKIALIVTIVILMM